MNAKKAWATVSFLLAGISVGIVYTKFHLPGHSIEKTSSALVVTGFYLLVGLLLWRQGQDQKKPNQSPEPTSPFGRRGSS